MRIMIIALSVTFGLGAILAGCTTPLGQWEAIENDGTRAPRGIVHRIPDGGD